MLEQLLTIPAAGKLFPDEQTRGRMLNILLFGFTNMTLIIIVFLMIADKTGIMPVSGIFYFAQERMTKTRVFLASANDLLSESLREKADLVLLKPVGFKQLQMLANKFK